ncbi:DUF1566 domain-containing protein [Pseudomonas sp. 57B-090624]|uniref:DUF1566 domain-containing protein n=1 Tax=Pseudomonas sp. 57B-090624 TaxID=2213080 RepID=UPI0021139728|nr:DUF1566 domain-containing protein [Pseudomonas sp. 57B-090624]
MILITINANGTTITTSDHQFATYAMALLEDQQDQSTPSDVPPLGAEWPGQGGINGGLFRGRDGHPDYYLIWAKEDAKDIKWGGYGDESKATSKWDGLANTKALLEEGSHSAAEYAASVEADGHADFYLPSQAELMMAWANVPELFSATWYWSSSQFSSLSAFLTGFTDGGTDYYAKDVEFRVRAVRRFIR